MARLWRKDKARQSPRTQKAPNRASDTRAAPTASVGARCPRPFPLPTASPASHYLSHSLPTASPTTHCPLSTASQVCRRGAAGGGSAAPLASEKGTTCMGFSIFSSKTAETKARIWPSLSAFCRIGSTAGGKAPSTQGPLWGYFKSQFLTGLSCFGDSSPHNGSKTVPKSQNRPLGYPHIGPFVVPTPRPVFCFFKPPET